MSSSSVLLRQIIQTASRITYQRLLMLRMRLHRLRLRRRAFVESLFGVAA